jgi:hypothetical protein
LAILATEGDTFIDATPDVVSVAEPLIPLNSALIVVGPVVVPAVASPDEPTVATAVSNDDQIANDVRFCIALFARVPEAANCWVVPGAILSVDGDTAITVTEEVVSVVDPVMVPDTAVMTAEPVVVAAVITSPRLLTVAIPVSDELQVADDERFCFVRFEKVPVAVNCRVVPGAMLGFVGVIAIEDSVAGGAGVPFTLSPPPHAVSSATSHDRHNAFNNTAIQC